MGKPIAIEQRNGTTNTALLARAFEIADKAMIEQLYSSCTVREGNRFWMESGSYDEVKSLSEANPGMRQAFDWMSRRGLATLQTNEEGWDFIELTPAGIKAHESDCLTLV